jgi:CIC family chloride channel protein
VVLVDGDDHYAGIVRTAEAYADTLDPTGPLGSIAVNTAAALKPDMDIKQVMSAFDATGADELAVLEPDRTVLGVLSESYVRRRYAEELEKAQRELFGER